VVPAPPWRVLRVVPTMASWLLVLRLLEFETWLMSFDFAKPVNCMTKQNSQFGRWTAFRFETNSLAARPWLSARLAMLMTPVKLLGRSLQQHDSAAMKLERFGPTLS
jgi:hypothetical protein